MTTPPRRAPATRATRALAPLAAVACAAGLAGCGESAVQKFRAALRPLQQQVQTERSQIAATLQAVGLNDRSGAHLLNQEIAQLDAIVIRMSPIKAPGAVARHDFAAYQRANRQLVASLYHVASVVARGSSRQLRGASLAATDAAGAVQRSSDALESALHGS